MVGSVWLSNWARHAFVRTDGPLASVVVPMGIRMFMPLAFVLAIVALRHPLVPAWSAMYIAPMYFVALLSETGFALHRCNQHPASHSGSADSTTADAAG